MKSENIQQIQRALPRSAWENITIKENNEKLVPIETSNKIKLGLDNYEASFLIRESVHKLLKEATQHLPENLMFVIIEGYRSMEKQELLYNEALNYLRKENPHLTDSEIETHVNLAIAKPHPLSNHNCGGAIDITLADTSGKLIDMGSELPHNNPFDITMRKKFPMHSEYITEEQANSRKLLREIMEKVGFVWYPAEWWHFCYGDRMWAVYTEQKECFYGSAME